MQTSRERAKSVKTLICFLQSLIDERATIELRDDTQICGTIKSVDSCMNVELTDVELKKCVKVEEGNCGTKSLSYEYLLLKGTKIRYVVVPDEVDALANIEKQIESIRSYAKRRCESIKSTKR